MKYIKLSLTLSLLIILFACQRGEVEVLTDKKPSDYVNPFIGTDFFGNVFPGASLPYALVHASPDTHNEGWLYRKGYIYTDDNIVGFSHTHGAGSGGEILLMPTVHQQIQLVPGKKDNPDTGYRSRFSHKEEKATPGYYQVKLLDYDVNAEITTTPRVAFHRYTFPESEFSRIILDLGYDIKGRNMERNCVLNIVNDTVIEGYRKSVNSTGNIYFAAHFSKPFEYFGTFDAENISPESHRGFYPLKSGEKGNKIGAFVRFSTKEDEQILVKVAISYVSLKGARKNLAAEIPHWNFDKTHRDAVTIWDMELGRIKVEGDSEQDKIKFYTAMYRTLLSQYIFQDVDGKYWGMDNKIQTADGYNFYSTIFTWDTYRTAHPLVTLAAPGEVNDILESIEAKIRESGWVPGLHSYNRFADHMVATT
jgi:predicted alpha-1,2-mannosidase